MSSCTKHMENNYFWARNNLRCSYEYKYKYNSLDMHDITLTGGEQPFIEKITAHFQQILRNLC